MKVKRSIKANLENKRGVFFQIGLVVSLSLVLLGFEWTTIQTNRIEWNKLGRGDIIEEMAEVTIHKKKLPEMPKPKIVHTIEIVENETEIEEEINISSEVTNETFNELEKIIEDEPDIEIEEPNIFTVVEKQPEFPGGISAMKHFLTDYLVYPADAKQIGISGTVYISFVVYEDGSIRNISVKRGIGGGCDEEAVRIVKLMPKWNPGKQRTKAVRVQMLLPVSFKLIN